MRNSFKTLFWLTLFGVAMGYLETAVVYYLRLIYYPHGFHFPLIPLETPVAMAEVWREAATLVMLVSIGIIAGKNAVQRFAYFLFSFAIWDISYYAFLKVLLDWPSSLFTWDLLFLIPVPWVGPVLAPCIMCVTMILFTINIVSLEQRGYRVMLNFREWLMLIVGSLVVIVSFVWDYANYVAERMHQHGHLWIIWNKANLLDDLANYVPVTYNWYIFSGGEIILLLVVLMIFRRTRSKRPASRVKRQW